MRTGRALAVSAALAFGGACAKLAAIDDWPGAGPPIDDGGLTDGDGQGDGDADTICTPSPGASDGGVAPVVDVDCGGKIVQLDNNELHCGECFHECPETDCVEGKCLPRVLSAERADVDTAVLGLSAERLYWSAGVYPDYVVRRSAPSGDGVATVIELDGGVLHHGALTDKYLFLPQFATRMAVVPVDDEANAFRVGGVAESISTLIARDDTVLYGMYREPSHIRAQQAVAESLPDDLLSNEKQVVSLALWEDELYFATLPEDVRLQGQINAVDLKRRTGIRRSLWKGRPSGLAVDGTHAFFFDNDKKEFLRTSLTLDGDAERLATWEGPENYAASLVLRGEFLYALLVPRTVNSVIVRVPKCGGAPVVLSSASAAGSIFVDDEYVYWGDVEGRVQRVPR